MPILLKLRALIARHFMDLRWYGVLIMLLAYVAANWLLLWLSHEDALLYGDFVYWLLVTASTVGYGDLSPSTPAGKMVVALFTIPVGIGLFALVVGRVAAFAVQQWTRGVKGYKALNIKDHILVLGWRGARTLSLLKLLVAESKDNRQRPVVLCVTDEMGNPLPDQISFARVEAYNHDADMTRAGVGYADCIIIDTPSDDADLTSALYCRSRNASAHMIVYFADEALGKLLRAHCPSVECAPSVAVEMIAKSAMDPGSSALHQQLLNGSYGMTQYSVRYPENGVPCTVADLYPRFKQDHNATLIAVNPPDAGEIAINPPLDTQVVPGAMLFYIADRRINDFGWANV